MESGAVALATQCYDANPRQQIGAKINFSQVQPLFTGDCRKMTVLGALRSLHLEFVRVRARQYATGGAAARRQAVPSFSADAARTSRLHSSAKSEAAHRPFPLRMSEQAAPIVR